MQVNLKEIYKVQINEYERGWGSKVDKILYFDNEKEAKDFVSKYNSRNTSITAPDWYMQAEYCGILN